MFDIQVIGNSTENVVRTYVQDLETVRHCDFSQPQPSASNTDQTLVGSSGKAYSATHTLPSESNINEATGGSRRGFRNRLFKTDRTARCSQAAVLTAEP